MSKRFRDDVFRVVIGLEDGDLSRTLAASFLRRAIKLEDDRNRKLMANRRDALASEFGK